MAKKNSIAFIYVPFILLLSTVIPLLCDANEDDDHRKDYIILLESFPEASSHYTPTSHHLSLLQQVINNGVNDVDDTTSSFIRSYTKSFNGFAAKLTSDEREKMSQMEGVVSVFESKTLRTQTTRSWDFMGFMETAIKRNLSAESDVIVGIIDTGIWPELESFNDEGFGDVPKKWRGTCAGGKNFTCNKKIIGARYYPEDCDSARDIDGHGTHTASIVAGNIVHDASFYGIAQGTARGGVPSARIAIYLACKSHGACDEYNILAAFDDAISDGVDIISLSLAKSVTDGFLYDTLAIGSFRAMENGILTVQAVGNMGPAQGTVSSVAPWILSVAASTTDRKIIDKVVLGNGQTLIGSSVNSFESNGSKFPLAKTNGDSTTCPKAKADDCTCFDTNVVKGKIVLCPTNALPIDSTAKSQGIVGAITTGSDDDYSEVVQLPTLLISLEAYDIVRSYKDSTENPEAEIKKSEIFKDISAPRIANFSSRGPNHVVAEVLKPDISAPGVDILAAYSPIAPVSIYEEDKRSVRYNILSGTSVSCPHVSGIAAYVKTIHSDWSPAAIKSAILTTAKPMTKNAYHEDRIGEFEYGSGHVNPVQAIDPGLVYDISKVDYVEMLCNYGYNATEITLISLENSTCPVSSNKELLKNLNYPSLAVKVEPLKPFKVMLNRTVTNVGFANSTYKASILPNSKVNITVEPEVLLFKSLNEKKSFVVTIVGGNVSDQNAVSSSLVWSDGTHTVRSPIVVMGSKQ